MIFVRFSIGGTLRSHGPFNTNKTPLALGLKASVKSSNDNYSLHMLQNNTSRKAKNATILHKYGHILLAVISRHEPITLSIPPTFQGNLIKQRIIQQISRIITCRVAYHHLSLFRRLHKLKKTKKTIICLTLSSNRQLFY